MGKQTNFSFWLLMSKNMVKACNPDYQNGSILTSEQFLMAHNTGFSKQSINSKHYFFQKGHGL